MSLPFGKAKRALEMLARALRHVGDRRLFHEARRQTSLQHGSPCLPKQRFPVTCRQACRRDLFNAQPRQKVGAHCRRAAASESKTATASSRRPYSKSWQSLALTTSARVSKPVRPSSV